MITLGLPALVLLVNPAGLAFGTGPMLIILLI